MTNKLDFLPSMERTESRILRVVFNTDLRNNHDGLTTIAKRLKIDTSKLKPGEFVVFINTAKTALKLFAAGQVVAHFRMPSYRKMDMRIIGLIPRFFNGRELKYDDALKDLLTTKWQEKNK